MVSATHPILLLTKLMPIALHLDKIQHALKQGIQFKSLGGKVTLKVYHYITSIFYVLFIQIKTKQELEHYSSKF